MSHDVFREVDEEVRREQLQKLWERYQYLIIGVVLLVVVGVGGWRLYEWHQTRLSAEIGTQFENAMALAESGKHDEAEKIFAQIAVNGTPSYRVLARIRQAAQLAERNPAAAAETYKQISADSGVEQVLRDLAALRAAGLLIDAGSHGDARRLLEPLIQPGRDFRHAARELLALNAWKSGDRPAAMKWYAAILTDPEAPSASRARVEMLMALGAADGKS
ncbi:MAG: tetratricopeptide repeat protein [Xanthobacteraceae bacterium]|nr:tetratricopeptide repeat protein [Xanthobacteraceae bacterium]